VLVVHACNPSYLGGRDQEDHTLPSAKYPTLKLPGGVAQAGAPCLANVRPQVQTLVPSINQSINQ
jgi:hypothetical protein